MIKKFDDFNIDDIKNNEREHFERELNARKRMRSEKSTGNDSNFNDIKDLIITEIQNKEDYHITTGKRLIELDGIKENEIHIEYQSPESGRIRIFKPKDTSLEGYFEVNGKIFHSDGNEIRNFYHFLSQEIIDKPIINESIRDFMKPKSEEEINNVWKRKIDEIFEASYNNKSQFFNRATYSKVWKKCTESYYLYDNYYIYKDKILYLQKSEEDFDALYIYKSIDEFKLESEDRINKIKLALKKL